MSRIETAMWARMACLIIAVVFICSICEEAVAGDEAAPVERLQFEQYGPSNATLEPFFVVIGDPKVSTREFIYVTQETYGQILTGVEKGSEIPPPHPLANQTSSVTHFKHESADKVYFIGMQEMLSILNENYFKRFPRNK